MVARFLGSVGLRKGVWKNLIGVFAGRSWGSGFRFKGFGLGGSRISGLLSCLVVLGF